MGLDLRWHSDTISMGSEIFIRIKRPTDSLTRIFKTYMSGDSELDRKLLLELCSAPGIRSDMTARTLMVSFRPSTLVKCFHRLTHATRAETERFMTEGGSMTEEMRR